MYLLNNNFGQTVIYPKCYSTSVVKPLNIIGYLLLLVSLSAIVVGAPILPITTNNNKMPVQEQATISADQRSRAEVRTQKPIIGVLTEVLRDYKRFMDTRHLHIAASYVKWIEAAGGQVLPVHLNRDHAYYELVFNQTNGLLFPGGDNLLDPNKNTPMMVAAKKLYKLAVEANDRGDFYPIWGTCLGLELLTVLPTERNTLENCLANDIPLAIEFRERGKMFAPADYANLNLGLDYSSLMLKAMSSKNLTYNFHHKCITDASLKRAQLDDFYRPLAYSKDVNGLEFIAIMEARKYPFYGVQFHPEKPPFEFVKRKGLLQVPHSREAIAVSRFFGDFFVNQAQLSGHEARSEARLALDLIYAYNPLYTALKNDIYEQRYLFPYNEKNSISSDEFLDYVPADDEEIPEDVALESESANNANAGRYGRIKCTK